VFSSDLRLLKNGRGKKLSQHSVILFLSKQLTKVPLLVFLVLKMQLNLKQLCQIHFNMTIKF